VDDQVVTDVLTASVVEEEDGGEADVVSNRDVSIRILVAVVRQVAEAAREAGRVVADERLAPILRGPDDAFGIDHVPVRLTPVLVGYARALPGDDLRVWDRIAIRICVWMNKDEIENDGSQHSQHNGRQINEPNQAQRESHEIPDGEVEGESVRRINLDEKTVSVNRNS
jgi:hypothetical protein